MEQERHNMGEVVDFKKYKILPLTKLVKADWNYKQDDEELTKKLVENIKRNGQIENLIVRELDTGFYEVVNGNHRFAALGIIGVEKAVVYDLGKVSQSEAYRLAIETNETKFLADHVKLAKLVKDMSADFTLEDLVQTLPYSPQEIDNYIKMSDFNWDEYNNPDNSSDDSSVKKKENELHLTLNTDVLDMWNKWKRMLITEGVDANDYNAFMVALTEAIEAKEDYDKTINGK